MKIWQKPVNVGIEADAEARGVRNRWKRGELE